jgi:hypothetical protein
VTYPEALALVLLWAIVADVLIIALIFWHGRQSMELNARLKNLRGLLEEERKERIEQRKQLQRFGAGMHELLDMLEMLFGPDQSETPDPGLSGRGKAEPHREPLEEHTTTIQSQSDRKAALAGPAKNKRGGA